MPRRSPFKIDLTDDELAELAARSHEYSLPFRDVLRARIVLLANQGLANDRIAIRLGTSRQIASKWRARFHDGRLAGLDDRPRSGRPARFSPQSGRRDQGVGL
jgi:hypothetical protein